VTQFALFQGPSQFLADYALRAVPVAALDREPYFGDVVRDHRIEGDAWVAVDGRRDR
jgi:hypothetical protein